MGLFIFLYLIIAAAAWLVAAFLMDGDGYTIFECIGGGFFVGLFWLPVVCLFGVKNAIEFLRDF